MSRNNRNKWFISIPLTYLNFLASTSFLGLSLYLDYIRPMPACAFCTFLRFVLALLMGLSTGAIMLPAYRRIIYPTQLGLSVMSLLLSLRQLYFEKMVTRLVACPRRGAHGFETIFNWLAKGAPACRKTQVVGFLPLSAWACIAFAILSFIAFRLYYKRAKRR